MKKIKEHYTLDVALWIHLILNMISLVFNDFNPKTSLGLTINIIALANGILATINNWKQTDWSNTNDKIHMLTWILLTITICLTVFVSLLT